MIGKGIKNVKVSVYALVSFKTAGTYNLIIQNGEDIIIRSISSASAGNQTRNLEKIIPVSEGDIIYLYIGAIAESTVNISEEVSWVTVEEK